MKPTGVVLSEMNEVEQGRNSPLDEILFNVAEELIKTHEGKKRPLKLPNKLHLSDGLMNLIKNYKAQLFTHEAFRIAQTMHQKQPLCEHAFRLNTRLYRRMRFLAYCIEQKVKKQNSKSKPVPVMSQAQEWRKHKVLKKFHFLSKYTLSANQVIFIILAVSKNSKDFQWFHDMRMSTRHKLLNAYGFSPCQKPKYINSYDDRVKRFSAFKTALEEAGFKTEEDIKTINLWCKLKGISLEKLKPKRALCKATQKKQNKLIPKASCLMIKINESSEPKPTTTNKEFVKPSLKSLPKDGATIPARSVSTSCEKSGLNCISKYTLRRRPLTAMNKISSRPVQNVKEEEMRNSSAEDEKKSFGRSGENNSPGVLPPIEVLQNDILLSRILAAASFYSTDIFDRVKRNDLPLEMVIIDFKVETERFSNALSPEDVIFIAEQILDQFEDSGTLYGELSEYIVDSVKAAAPRLSWI